MQIEIHPHVLYCTVLYTIFTYAPSVSKHSLLPHHASLKGQLTAVPGVKASSSSSSGQHSPKITLIGSGFNEGESLSFFIPNSILPSRLHGYESQEHFSIPAFALDDRINCTEVRLQRCVSAADIALLSCEVPTLTGRRGRNVEGGKI